MWITSHSTRSQTERSPEQYIEQIEGEVQMDAYVKAQASAPQVVKRITELENCIWRLCDELSRFDEHNRSWAKPHWFSRIVWKWIRGPSLSFSARQRMRWEMLGQQKGLLETC